MEDFLLSIINNAGMPLLAVAVPVVVAAIKKVLPKLPSWSIPVIAALGPVVVDQIIAVLGNVEALGWKAALLGLIGIGIREIFDQVKTALTAP